jgi:8-amino-7-oxononanoate synthase
VAAQWQGTEAALLFPSGYQANLALLSTLPSSGDCILSDELNHASLIDGCRLSKAKVQTFAHNDLSALRQLLAAESGTKWIVTERVFSMDGDQSPVQEILNLCDEFDAFLMLDEAHSSALYSVLPPHPRLISRMVSGGKALGVGGALVCGSKVLIQTLVNRARSFIYSTANQPASAAALAESIRLVQDDPKQIQAVHNNATHLRDALSSADFQISGNGPIVPVLLGDANRALQVAQLVQADGFDVRAIRPPTVPEGECRIRLVIHADHTKEQIEALAHSLISAWRCSAAQPLVICGTDTDIGKTILSSLTVLQMKRMGQNPGYLKPVQTGRDSDTETVRLLTGLTPENTPDPILEFGLPASIDQAAEFENRKVSAQEIVDGVLQIVRGRPTVRWVMEGAGGLLVPLNSEENQSDYLQKLGYPILLAARSALGTLNHTLLAVEALRHRGLPLLGILLIGGKHPGNLRSLRKHLPNTPVLEIPNFDHLDRRHMQSWLDEGHFDELIPGPKPQPVPQPTH